MTKEITVTKSTGNVFADLRFDEPETELLKAELVRRIRALLKRRGLTQVKAGEVLGLTQPDVSALVNGKVNRFSVERLSRCAQRLDQEVKIVVRPRLRRRMKAKAPSKRPIRAA